MKITMKSKRPLLDDKLGRLMHGDVVEMPEHKARFYLERGDASAYLTKVVDEAPYVEEVVQETPKLRARKAK